MGNVKQIGQKSSRKSLKSSASLLGLAAGAVGWSGLAQAASEESGSQMMLLPEHYELMENGVVVFKLETGENLSLNADQYLILEDGLLLITDELAQASIYSLPVMGSVRAQLLSDLEQVATIDGTVAEATPTQTLSITEGQAPRLSEQVELQSYEVAQASADDANTAGEALTTSMAVAPGAMALLGMLMTSDQPEEPEEPEEEADPFGNLVPSNDLFVGTYTDGSAGTFSAESYFGTGSGSPASEKVLQAFDGDQTTKYLNFKVDGGLLLDFDRAVTPTAFDIREANDHAGRNPDGVELYWASSDLAWGDAGWTLAYTADFDNPNPTTFFEQFTDANGPFSNTQAAQYWKIAVTSIEATASAFQFSNIDMGLDWGNDGLPDL